MFRSPENAGTSSTIDPHDAPSKFELATAFIQLLHSTATTIRVDLLDLNDSAAAFRAMIPVPQGAFVVLSVAQHPPVQGIFLARVTHCTKLANGRYLLNALLLERRDGNLNITRIPEAWRLS